MSVLIKGKALPKCCGDCWLARCVAYSDYCRVLSVDINVIDPTYKHPNCPLVEVPEPHGRLIDELRVIDAIHERLEVLRTHEVFVRKHGDIDLLGVMPYIAKIPTVVEAEGIENHDD